MATWNHLTMKLSDDDFAKLKDHIELTWVKAECPMCNKNRWSFEREVYELRSFHKGTPATRGAIFPACAVVCLVCGFTVFVNPLVVGATLGGGDDA
jgi:hypothetical protein